MDDITCKLLSNINYKHIPNNFVIIYGKSNLTYYIIFNTNPYKVDITKYNIELISCKG